jgi:glutaredoxin
VTLLSKPGCHLCDDAREVVADICADLEVAWVERDITADATEQARYWEEIPVVLIDGRQHAYWTVDATRLRDALTG